MQNERFPKTTETISQGFASLKSASIGELKQQWRMLYGSAPPHRISRQLLTRAVGYRMQEQVHGGLKPRPEDCSFFSPTTRDRDAHLELNRSPQRQREPY
jgi:hypothetical protein